MAFLFGGGRTSNTDTIKDYQRRVAGNARGMEREIARLDQRETLLQRELSKFAKDSKMEAATSKAREIVRLRAHRERLRTVRTQMTGLAQQLQSVQSSGKVQEMIAGTVHMLHSLNSRLDAGGVGRMLAEFERQSVQMQAKQELVDDALDAGFEADGEQEDCTEAVIGVLEEVGLDMRSQLGATSGKGGLPLGALPAENDIAARIEQLRVSDQKPPGT